MQPIKNIIFDLGHVILNVDWDAVRRQFESMGFKRMDELHRYLLDENYYFDLETGRITPAEFRDAVRRLIGDHTPDELIDKGWNSMLLDVPGHRVELLEKLRSKYDTYLLSNTNQIHWEQYDAEFAKIYGYAHLSDLFKAAYFSHLMGLRKPDPEIYRVVLNEQGLIPEETLFIDDMVENIRSAERLGIVGHYLAPGQDITGLFDEGLNYTGKIL